jgi:RNA polymerase sigma-70 factor (ECF subfamily)
MATSRPAGPADGRADPARTTPRLLSDAREDDLRARLAARDEQALAELVQLLSPWLLGVAQAMLRDVDEAEDVVLETFRVAWDRVPPPGQGPRGLLAWLLQVTRNRAIDRLRSRRRRWALGERIAVTQEVTSAPAEPNEAAYPGWHVHTAVHSAIAELPEDQQIALRLAYFEGHSQSEVAERLAIPLGTVKTRLRLALEKLRASLSGLKDWIV